MEEKKQINQPATKESEKRKINQPPVVIPTVGSGDLKIPHIGKKPFKEHNLFKDGPSRGGSLGNFPKKK